MFDPSHGISCMKLFEVQDDIATARMCVEERHLIYTAAILLLNRSSDIDHKHMIRFLHG